MSLLDRYAANTVKRPKTLIAVAVVIIILLSFNAPHLDEYILYSIDLFIPTTLEAKRTQEIISTKIGVEQADVEFIVVEADGSRLFSEDGRLLLSRLTRGLEESSGVTLKGVREVVSITKVYDEVLNVYWLKMNETYRNIEDFVRSNLTKLHLAFYEMVDSLHTLHTQLYHTLNNLTAASEIVYGVPALYLKVWSNTVEQMFKANPTRPISTKLVNELAFNTSLAMLPADGRALTESYLKAFYSAWSSSLKEDFLSLSDLTPQNLYGRAQEAIDSTAPLIFNSATLGKASLLFTKVHNIMNLTTWLDASLRHDLLKDVTITLVSEEAGLEPESVKKVFNLGAEISEQELNKLTVDLLSERQVANRTLLETCLELGRNPTSEEIDAVVKSVTSKLFEDIKARFPKPSFPESIPKDLYNRFVSSDNKTTIIIVRFNHNLTESEKEANIKSLHNIVEEVKEPSFTILLTGPMSLSHDIKSINTRDIENIDKATIIVVFILGAFVLTSLVVPSISLITVGAALFAALGLLTLLSSIGFKPYYLLRSMISVVTLGAGVDYVIFMLFRYLEERTIQSDNSVAVKRTALHAGGAVVLSASAVIIGFLSLTLSEIGILRSIGLGLAIGILITLAAALLIIPSTLFIVKERILWPRKRIPTHAARIVLFRRMAHYCVSKPKKILAIGLLITVALGVILSTITVTFNDIEMLPPFESKEGVEHILNAFGAAPFSQAQVVVLSKEPLFYDTIINVGLYLALDRLGQEVSAVDGVVAHYTLGPTRPNGTYISPEEADKSIIKQFMDKEGKIFLITTSLKHFYTSDEAFRTIKSIREKAAELVREEKALSGAEILVGGSAAFYYDIMSKINADFLYFIIPVACVSIFLILLIALGSFIIPLRLLATTAMSVVWSLALLVLVFQHWLGFQIYWLTPFLTFALLMGLGMDYDIFLITRVREEALKGFSDEQAVVNAVEKTGLVLTGAGLILGSALATLMLSPNIVLKEMGFALSAAIFIDTFFMRLVFNPSIIVVAKKWNWWPRRLAQKNQ
ncbi:MAG: MMPL family transporter [Nitrososphaerales archaeon]